VLGSSRRVVLSVSLTNLATGDTREAETTGPLDSLAVLVDRVALQLLPAISGEPAPRAAGLARTPMTALRAYLAGRSAFRAGRFDEALASLREAVALDSSFAIGAFELAYVAGFTSEGAGRYLPHAVALADRLPAPDRAILSALAGPRYPAWTPIAESMDAWERATRAAPQSPEAWYDFGDFLFHAGAALGRDTGFARAEMALRRAADLDSSDARALVHLVQIAARRGDVAETRRLAELVFARDSTTEQAVFLRWRVAVANGDTAAAARIESALDTLPLGAVRRLADWSQADGVRPGLAPRAVDVFARRAVAAGDVALALRLQLVVHANAGRFGAWMSAAHRYVPDQPVSTFAMQAYAWYDGGRDRSAMAAESGVPAARSALATRDCEDRRPGACDTLRAIIAAMPADRRTRDTLPALLAAAALRSPDAESLAAGVEGMRHRALSFAELAAHSYFQGRAYAALGRTALALEALRRRPYATMEANNYLAPSLRLEGRLAAQLGDTAGAVRAYRHYLVLRSDPDPEVRPIVDAVRTELQRLSRSRH
jgi:tetratricopeptide (TPR) repeat protein